ncbi:cyanophycin synthetase [Oculatella sp. LEGE 06141]|uniref:acetate--CoA ligase family protein n=1 Tax=Oculatella sp. LEGE 06141 TaxID=1828648 RepID=UPI00188096D0|nr:acetate--CoA ligase family protein [Oculatella sp. LEGE 06141]MBE9179537.1 cyanophycin synthetase [Oculatella sp. LEGE 06141]
MVLDQETNATRVNARSTDAFDVFNCQHYVGPNPYLDTAAFVFDLTLVQPQKLLPLDQYIAAVGDRYPHLLEERYDSYTHLFARTVSEVNKLEMDLYFERWSVSPHGSHTRIGIECLHARTCRAVVYSVWDWFEAINQHEEFEIKDQIEVIQGLFRQSVYGGPTVYALLRAAHNKEIPTFYLWDEGLMQYGYGRRQVRGVATTFDGDSHLDSDFTTRKDDCKAFLGTLGFPVPKGEVVRSRKAALAVAARIGYPVAVKPVSGHKGIGVTADVQDAVELEEAYHRALQAIPEDESVRIIVETSISGKDFRMLCVNGRFVAATERRPAYVVGDGQLTIAELIDRENRLPARIDTPTSPLGKIKTDEAMHMYLEQQGLTLDSVLERDRTVYLRKVANLSSGGLSIDATHAVHPDNIILTQDIAQHFRLTCLGIDVVAHDLSKSWKDGNFGIIEINAAPGIYMHLKPAMGESVDVTSHVMETFFESKEDARIPIITFNHVRVHELQEMIDFILLQHPDWVVGAVCQEAVLVNRAEKNLHSDYNINVSNLLRNPKLDLLMVEYQEDVLQRDGMFYHGSNVVILDNPTDTEMMLKRDVFHDSTIVVKRDDHVSIQRGGLIEQYQLNADEPFSRVFLKEIATIL